MIEVKVPTLAESTPDATLLEWKKRSGDAINKDELLIEIETDKVILEVTSPTNGILKEIVHDNGAVVSSDTVIATIEVKHQNHMKNISGNNPRSPNQNDQVSRTPTVSPAARKLAADSNLNTGAITGTGRNGLITKQDVINALKEDKVSEEIEEAMTPSYGYAETNEPIPRTFRNERRESMSRLRQRIAERLVQSQQNAAILTTFNEINMQPVLDLRFHHKDTFQNVHGVRLGFMSFFSKAVTAALQKIPIINASIDGSDIVYHDYIDIGIAVDSPRGLVVPILRNVDSMSFAEIELAISDFTTRARDNSLKLEELTGGTFTISNGGVFGSLLSTPIINPPQTAILGMHKWQERPVAENGEVVIRPMMYLALSYDHRIIDGREAVTFLVAVKNSLEDPGRMLLGL